MRGVFKQSILSFCCFFFSIQSAHSMVELNDECEYNNDFRRNLCYLAPASACDFLNFNDESARTDRSF